MFNLSSKKSIFSPKCVPNPVLSLPEELLIAMYGSSVGLGAGTEFNFEGDKALLPRSAHSLIKSMFGIKLAKVCSYMKVGDVAMGAAALSASEEFKTAH